MKRLRSILFLLLPLLGLLAGGRLTAAAEHPAVPQKNGYHKQERIRSSEGLHTVSIRISVYNAPARYSEKQQQSHFSGTAAAFDFNGALPYCCSVTTRAAASPQQLPRYLALRRLLI